VRRSALAAAEQAHERHQGRAGGGGDQDRLHRLVLDVADRGVGCAQRAVPHIGRTVAAAGAPRARSIETTILTALALLYSLYLAREFLIPIVFALLLNFLLSPLVRRLLRWRVNPPLSAAIIVVLLIGAAAEGIYQLSGPAQRWAVTAPQSFSRAEHKLRTIIRPVQQVTKNVERAASTRRRIGVPHVRQGCPSRP